MKTIEKAVQSEINIKKSQFICSLFPTKSKKESKEIIQKLNQQYHDATHNCTAYITNDGEGYDDNGEPGGTAGKPMINALRKNDLHNVTAVVTRYFGGTLLGTGGLVRAYTAATIEGLKNSESIARIHGVKLGIETNYTDLGKIQYLIANRNLDQLEPVYSKLTIIQKDFGEKISYDLVSKNNRNIKEIFEKFHNKIKVNFKNKQVLKKIK